MPDSSPETVVEETSNTAAQAAPDGKAAESSTAEKGGSMLDAVMTALKPTEESPASETPEQAETPASDDQKQEETEEEDELSADEIKALGQKTQLRFKRLKSKLDGKDGELNTLRPKAEEFDKIVKFTTEAGLSNDNVSELLQIGALLRSDPKAAYERMLPTIQALQKHLGYVLSPELNQQVQHGYLTEQHARELARAQAGEQHALNMAERQRQEAAARDAQLANKAKVDSVMRASETWEAKKAERDPDWHLKRAEVSEKVELAIYKAQQKNGATWFPDAKEAIEMAETALKDVEKRFKRNASKPTEIIPPTSDASSRAKPVPKTMEEAVRFALSAG